VFVEAQCPKQTDSKSRITPERRKTFYENLLGIGYRE